MTSLRTQNALLFVIAACLVLLVVHFYSGHLVAKVYAAQAVSAPAGANAVALYGCYRYSDTSACAWKELRSDGSGHLLTK